MERRAFLFLFFPHFRSYFDFFFLLIYLFIRMYIFGMGAKFFGLIP